MSGSRRSLPTRSTGCRPTAMVSIRSARSRLSMTILRSCAIASIASYRESRMRKAHPRKRAGSSPMCRSKSPLKMPRRSFPPSSCTNCGAARSASLPGAATIGCASKTGAGKSRQENRTRQQRRGHRQPDLYRLVARFYFPDFWTLRRASSKSNQPSLWRLTTLKVVRSTKRASPLRANNSQARPLGSSKVLGFLLCISMA